MSHDPDQPMLPRAVFGGYKRRQTDDFLRESLETVAELWRDLKARDDRLRVLEAELKDARTQLEDARSLEHRLARAFADVNDAADRIREGARQEAEALADQARYEAAELRRTSEQRARAVIAEAEREAQERVARSAAEVEQQKQALAELQATELDIRTRLMRVLGDVKPSLFPDDHASRQLLDSLAPRVEKDRLDPWRPG